jgi:ABC-2 type transport system ATP-binding protein
VLERVGLAGASESDVARLSSGQRRRLDLALALVGDPEVLFLDEATAGFDPAARRDAWEIVRSVAAGGTTVFLTTNSMEEAQELADRLAVLNRGELIAEGAPPKPEDREAGPTRVRFRVEDPTGMPTLGFEPAADGTLEISTDEPAGVLHELTAWALANGRELEGLEVRRPTLEDVYLELIRGDEEGA